MDKVEFFKRDTSWLSFNHRVLQEAKDKTVPLYERIKFLAIYSSNLDEFFRVRVASLRNLKQLKKQTRKEIEIKPKKELKEIKKIVQKQQNEFGRIYRNQILAELAEEGIILISDIEEETNEEQQEFVRAHFQEHVAPLLKIDYLFEDQEAPFLVNKGLYFLFSLHDEEQVGCVNIPTDEVDRFITLPRQGDRYHIAFVDDVMRFCLPSHLQKNIDQVYAVKVSRDAEMYIDDEYEFPDELVNKIKSALDERNLGAPTRFLYDNSMPKSLLKRIKEIFNLDPADLTPGARYHNFNDFFGFPDPTGNAALHDTPMPPLPHTLLENAYSIIDLLQERDVMLHFPYQRYDYVPRFIRQAAEDPLVEEIKITLYRVAAKSAVVEALLFALQNGKKVTAFIEAKARFDEASNLYWGEELKKAGALVMYSIPGIKVHTKLLVISRKEEEALRYYTYLGTGNFNEKTAKLYCDHALLTADQRLGKEVEQIFDILERKIIIPKTKHLFVSPFSTRNKFASRIDKEIRNAKAGLPAYMILKMNSLEDPGMIEKLYEASQAGVRIQLIVRGICCLVPGVPDLSENIEVISIVDRFLEHARVYIFGNAGKELMYTASADWMIRNLDRRIEVVIPIYDQEVYHELRQIINIQLQDNTKARLINSKQNNPYRKKGRQVSQVRAQEAIYAMLRQKTEAGSGVKM